MKKLFVWLIFLAGVLFCLFTVVLLYLDNRHSGISYRKRNTIALLSEQNDVAKLNEMFVNETSLSVKLEILEYLDKKLSLESVPYLIDMLDYDWEDWEKAVYIHWSELEVPRPVTLRVSTAKALSKYGNQINEQLIEAVNESVGYKQLYASVLLLSKGMLDYTRYLDYYSQDSKFIEDLKMIRSVLSFSF